MANEMNEENELKQAEKDNQFKSDTVHAYSHRTYAMLIGILAGSISMFVGLVSLRPHAVQFLAVPDVVEDTRVIVKGLSEGLTDVTNRVGRLEIGHSNLEGRINLVHEALRMSALDNAQFGGNVSRLEASIAAQEKLFNSQLSHLEKAIAELRYTIRQP